MYMYMYIYVLAYRMYDICGIAMRTLGITESIFNCIV